MNKSSSKGSALLIILIFTATLSVVVGSLLKWGSTEHRINERQFVRLKTQNAVESVLETGVAQLVARWEYAKSFPFEELAPGNQPVSLPSNISTFFQGSPINVQNIEIYGGPIPNGAWAYIDPTDPANELDPQKGKQVYARNVTILAKAEGLLPKSGAKFTAFAKEVLQIRDAPLFSHAIYYNMDLEFHPGPAMNMHGPVHTNGNLYGSAGGNLYFHSAVTSAKDYYHGLAPNHPEGPQSGKVWFKDSGGNFINDYTGSGSPTSPSNYYDSNTANWESVAMNRWHGFLTTKEHGVPNLAPMGFENYVRDDPSTSAVDDDLNYAYAAIEPNLKVKNKVNHPDYKDDGEKEKFAYKAGLIIRVHNTTSSPSNKAHQLSTNYWVTFHRLDRSNKNEPNSEPKLTASGELKEKNIKIDSSYVAQLMQMNEYSEGSNGKPNSGFYDLRRGRGLDVLEFDVGKFREAVDDTDTNYDGDSNGIWKSKYKPRDDYNGVVYVEMPWNQAQTGRSDKIVTSNENMGLMLKNGTTIPSPSYNATNPLRDEGFTLATNNHMYVKGHYNADGTSSTGSATDPDSETTPEPPAALAADAITILSGNWNITKSKDSNKSQRPATFTEVNFGMIQGLVPTGKGGTSTQSGGNHNFPRFLEEWSGKTFRYRGSMVALFESEIGNQPHNNSFYSPPVRDWGFYKKFKEGKFPPGTPNARTFRRISFDFLDLTAYNQELQDINSEFGI